MNRFEVFMGNILTRKSEDGRLDYVFAYGIGRGV